MKYSRSDIGFDGKHFTFAPGIYQELKRDFFNKEVDAEIQKAERWLLFNEPKRDHRRFLCNWLNNSYPKQGIKLKDEPKYERREGKESTPHTIDFGESLRKMREA